MELKFRCYDKKQKRMVYFNLYSLCNGVLHSDIGPDTEIDKCSITQYIGRSDSKGTEIYGGDIAFNGYDRDKNHEILWSSYNACWCLGDEDSYPIRVYALKDYWEVIGNIWENPELLEANQ